MSNVFKSGQTLFAKLRYRVRNSLKSRSERRHPIIIEHMEVDLVFSRLHAKHNLRIIDIGAHHGEFPDIFELHNDDHTYDVVCVEPMPETVSVLKQRIKHYKRVKITICDVAISDVSGPKTFYQGAASTLFTCTKEWKQIFPENFQQSKEMTIHCLTVADLFKQFGIDTSVPFDFVKIDTEGHDLNVLRSLLAAGIRPFALMFEIGPDLAAVEEAVRLLKDHGFTEFYMFGRTGIPTTYIGEYRGSAHLTELVNKEIINTGNVVVFK